VPYDKASEVPDYVPSDKKKQWMEVWNSVYKKAKNDGKSDKTAETEAFTQANGVIKKEESKGAAIMPELRICLDTEVRALGTGEDADPLRIEGYAAKFGKYSQDLGGFKEKITPGTFANAIKNKSDVRCLANHNPDILLGRTKNGTLALREDNTGLWYSCLLPKTTAARDLHATIARGDMDQCSFSFTVPKGGDAWTEEQDDNGDWFASRTLVNVDLFDAGPVTFPAYLDTEVNARSMPSVPLELRSMVDAKNKEKRDQSFEKIMDAVQDALCQKYGNCAGSWDCPSMPRYWLVETYPDAAVVCDWDNDCYYRVAYTNAEGKITLADSLEPVEQTWIPTTERGAVRLAEYRNKRKEAMDNSLLTSFKSFEQIFDEVLKERGLSLDTLTDTLIASMLKKTKEEQNSLVAFETTLTAEIAKRTTPPVEVKTEPAPVVTEPAPKEQHDMNASEVSSQELDEMDEDPDSDDVFDGDEPAVYNATHTDDGDCSDAECNCQNRWSVTGDEMLSIEPGERQLKVGDVVVLKSGSPDMVVLTASSENEQHVATEWPNAEGVAQRAVFPVTSLNIKEQRAKKKVRTKRVGGKDLPKSKFAYVGDPDRTETWKLPIHDANHVRNALARFNQTDGIPADKKAAVKAKIVAAAHKFGIDVSKEKDSAPEPEVTKPVITDEENNQLCQARAKIIAAMLGEEIE
jgi:HK97 family phage prohead protease